MTLSENAWTAIGLSTRMERLRQKMWDAVVERRQHITVLADGAVLGEIDWDFTKDAGPAEPFIDRHTDPNDPT